jgi:ADP-ribose pyrophosphatase
MWAGKYITALKRGRWEYVSRTGSTNAVVILAETDGKVILIEQYRVPVGGRCLELPAGLEHLGCFHSSPGMVAESFTLVRAHGIRKVGEGGGTEHEEITVHLVGRDEIAAFIQSRRDAGTAVDVKLLLFLDY